MIKTIECEICCLTMEDKGYKYCRGCKPELYPKLPVFTQLKSGDFAGSNVVHATQNCIDVFGWKSDAVKHTGWQQRNIIPKELTDGIHDVWFFLYTENNRRKVASGHFISLVEKDKCILVSTKSPPKWASNKVYIFSLLQNDMIGFEGEYNLKVEYDKSEKIYGYTFEKIGDILK